MSTISHAGARKVLSRCLMEHTAAGKAKALNDLYELDTNNSDEYKWRQITPATAPPPRTKHCAIAVGAVLQAWYRALRSNWPPPLPNHHAC